MKTISKLMISGLFVLIALAMNAQVTVDVELTIIDRNNSQYEATFYIYDNALQEYVTITSTNPITGLQNGTTNIQLTIESIANSEPPRYYIGVSVKRTDQQTQTDIIGLLTSEELVYNTHEMEVNFN